MYASSSAIRSPSASFFETWFISLKIFSPKISFSRNNADSEKTSGAQLKSSKMADLNRGTPFFIRSKGGNCDPAQPSPHLSDRYF